MSTLKTTNLQHPSAGVPAIVLDADGDATYAGVHDFSAATVTGAPQGLVHINTTTLSAVSSVSFNNIFTADFDYYRIMLSAIASINMDLSIRLRAGGTDVTAANYFVQFCDIVGTGVFPSSANGLTGWTNTLRVTTPTGGSTSMDIFQPYNAKPTTYNLLNGHYLAAPRQLFNTGGHTLSTSYDGLTIYAASGTFTGAISVFGYSKS